MKIHGHSKRNQFSKTYNSWRAMKSRCYNPSNEKYNHYGERGIIVCDRWHTFTNFLEDMGERPKGMTLDRINVELNYDKENCKWSNQKDQTRNKRDNRLIEYNGEYHCVSEWSEILDITTSSLFDRFNRNGNSIEEIIEHPINDHLIKVEYNGELKTLREWSKELNLNHNTLYYRLQQGWSIEESFNYSYNARLRMIEYKGRTQSLKEWCNELNLKYDAVRCRLDRDWTIEDAFTLPFRKSRTCQQN